MTTDGVFTFTAVPSGTYVVSATLPTGFVSSAPTTNTAGIDNNDNGSKAGPFVISAPFTATPGTNDGVIVSDDTAGATVNPAIDFGIVSNAYDLGNRVWFDTNNNGVMDTNEQPVEGVTVTLQTPGGELTDVTDADGYYSFEGLEPGVYTPVIAAANFAPGVGSTPGGALEEYWSSTGASTDATATGSGKDHGVDPSDRSAYLVDGVAGVPVTLGQGLQPVGEDSTSPALANGDARGNQTADFGFYTQSIGNVVWNDLDNDGRRDAGEDGLPGITVTLYAATGGTETVVDTTTTDANGAYLFTQVPSGTFSIGIVPPSNGTSSIGAGGEADPASNIDDSSAQVSDNGVVISAGEIRSAPFAATPGDAGALSNNTVDDTAGSTNNPTLDFGVFAPAQLGNKVWEDLDHDGVQDPNEPGVPNVTVVLTGPNGPVTTTTDSNGGYLFTDLISGTYQVTFLPPNGYTFTLPGGTPGNDTDSNADPVTGVTTPVVINAGDANLTIDAGLWRPASLGNTVWLDRDRDGLQDAGETGMNGVEVTLLDKAGNVVSTTTTASIGGVDGIYTFTNLISDTYHVSFALPAGFTATTPNTATNTFDLTDSDGIAQGDPAAVTGDVPLFPGDVNPTVDQGLWKPLSLGNLVWEDVNNNGVVDGVEAGIDGVQVQLFADADKNGIPDGAALATQTTTNGGRYLFTDLPEGNYVVRVTLPAGYAGSTGQNGNASGPVEPGIAESNAAGDDSRDHGSNVGAIVSSGTVTLTNDIEPTTESDTTLPTGITNGADDANTQLTVDFGLFKPASLGDTVWYDNDYDGAQDSGEAGVPNATVVLYDALTNAPVATTTTDGNGIYTFTNLISGTYAVQFVTSTLPSGYIISPLDNPTAGDASDSDADPVTGQAAAVTLGYGETNTTIDAGIYRPDAGLGDRVWEDLDHDGFQDPNEPGIADVPVTLYQNGVPVSTTQTNASGYYSFTDLVPGTYSVTFGTPAGYLPTINAGAIGDPGNSDADPVTGGTGDVVLPANQFNPNIDAGFWRPASLGDTVWEDFNHDGAQNDGPTGVAGVLVTLFNDAGDVVSTTVTGPNGDYMFTNLISDTYYVSFTLPVSYTFTTNDAAGDGVDSDANTLTGVTGLYVLNAGESIPTVDAGIWRPAALGNYVWVDVNHDGVQDPNEPPVAGVTVELLDANGIVTATQQTNTAGQYLFTDLISATYQVRFVTTTLPAGFAPTVQGSVGFKDAPDNDPDANGMTEQIGLVAGETRHDMGSRHLGAGGAGRQGLAGRRWRRSARPE